MKSTLERSLDQGAYRYRPVSAMKNVAFKGNTVLYGGPMRLVSGAVFTVGGNLGGTIYGIGKS